VCLWWSGLGWSLNLTWEHKFNKYVKWSDQRLIASTDDSQFTWLWWWLPLRLSKRQSMSSQTVLLRTTLTHSPGRSHFTDLWTPHILRWLPRVSTKVTIPTGKSYKRNPSSVILQSLFLRFASKVTNIITLIFQFCFLGIGRCHATKRLKNDGNFPLIHLYSLVFWFSLGETFLNFPILWKRFLLTFCRGKNMGSFRRFHRFTWFLICNHSTELLWQNFSKI